MHTCTLIICALFRTVVNQHLYTFADCQDSRQWCMCWHAWIPVGIISISIVHLHICVPLCTGVDPACHCSINLCEQPYNCSLYCDYFWFQAKDAFRRSLVKRGKWQIWIGVGLDVAAILLAVVFVILLIVLEGRRWHTFFESVTTTTHNLQLFFLNLHCSHVS